MEKTVLIGEKRRNLSVFQVMLLDNNQNRDVKVNEAKRLDFRKVKAHLKSGGSVFITIKNIKKGRNPNALAMSNYNRTRRRIGSLYRLHLRN